MKKEGDLAYIKGYLSYIKGINRKQYEQLVTIYRRYDQKKELFADI